MKIIISKSLRIVFPATALCIFFLALIWVSYVRQKTFDRKDAIQFAIEKNSNLAVALEQHAISTLQNTELVLQLVRLEYAREGVSLNLEKLFVNGELNRNIIEGIFIINSTGKLVKAKTKFSQNLISDYSAIDYFIYHSKHNVDSLIISKPLISTPTGKPYIVISCRFNDSKGKFGGVVAVQMEPSVFTSFYAQAKLLPNDIISLISPDGTTYARRTGTTESSGEDIHKSPLFVHLANNPDSFYLASDAIRHIPTWFSYRKLKNYPIIATVGRSEQDILSVNRNRESRYLTPRIITSVLIILFSFLITLFLLHRRRASDRLLEEKDRYERLLVEQMISVQEREREWIGRELHDNVSQVLTTVKLYLEMTISQQVDPLIPKSIQLINSSIIEIRNLSHQLSAPTLGTRSLVDSINTLIEMVGRGTNIIFEFDYSRYHSQLIMDQKLALYRILQEQINNILKHAAATKVWISLFQSGNNVMLTVRDNGKGFDNRLKTGGMGLNNIISRVKVLGGTVQIETAPQKGCFLRVLVPIITC